MEEKVVYAKKDNFISVEREKDMQSKEEYLTLIKKKLGCRHRGSRRKSKLYDKSHNLQLQLGNK